MDNQHAVAMIGTVGTVAMSSWPFVGTFFGRAGTEGWGQGPEAMTRDQLLRECEYTRAGLNRTNALQEQLENQLNQKLARKVAQECSKVENIKDSIVATVHTIAVNATSDDVIGWLNNRAVRLLTTSNSQTQSMITPKTRQRPHCWCRHPNTRIIRHRVN